MNHPKYSEILRDDKHLELLLKMTDAEINGNILDVGTGSGYLAFPLAEAHPHHKVVGIDITPNIIEKNNRKAAEEELKNVEFISFDGIHYPFESQSFGLIITRYAFHHFPDIREIAKQFSTMLNEQGRILISDPVRHERDANHVIDQFMRVKGDGHIQFYTPEEIARIFSEYGIVVETNQWTSMKFPFPQRQEYLDLFASLSDAEREMYDLYQKDETIWVGKIDVTNILLRKGSLE